MSDQFAGTSWNRFGDRTIQHEVCGRMITIALDGYGLTISVEGYENMLILDVNEPDADHRAKLMLLAHSGADDHIYEYDFDTITDPVTEDDEVLPP